MLRQSNLTIHTAASYLDTIFLIENEKKKIEEKRLRLITAFPDDQTMIKWETSEMQLSALTCLLVACKVLGLVLAKYEELDNNIPLIEDFQKVIKYKFSFSRIVKSEGELLQRLGWNLYIVTPLHFLYALIGMGIVFNNDSVQGGDSINKSLVKSINKYAEYFIDISTQIYQLKQYKASLITCGAIACARRVNKVEPLWNELLVKLTGHSFSGELKEIENEICIQKNETPFTDSTQRNNESSNELTEDKNESNETVEVAALDEIEEEKYINKTTDLSEILKENSINQILKESTKSNNFINIQDVNIDIPSDSQNTQEKENMMQKSIQSLKVQKAIEVIHKHRSSQDARKRIETKDKNYEAYFRLEEKIIEKTNHQDKAATKSSCSDAYFLPNPKNRNKALNASTSSLLNTSDRASLLIDANPEMYQNQLCNTARQSISQTNGQIENQKQVVPDPINHNKVKGSNGFHHIGAATSRTSTTSLEKLSNNMKKLAGTKNSIGNTATLTKVSSQNKIGICANNKAMTTGKNFNQIGKKCNNIVEKIMIQRCKELLGKAGGHFKQPAQKIIQNSVSSKNLIKKGPDTLRCTTNPQPVSKGVKKDKGSKPNQNNFQTMFKVNTEPQKHNIIKVKEDGENAKTHLTEHINEQVDNRHQTNGQYSRAKKSKSLEYLIKPHIIKSKNSPQGTDESQMALSRFLPAQSFHGSVLNKNSSFTEAMLGAKSVRVSSEMSSSLIPGLDQNHLSQPHSNKYQKNHIRRNIKYINMLSDKLNDRRGSLTALSTLEGVEAKKKKEPNQVLQSGLNGQSTINMSINGLIHNKGLKELVEQNQSELKRSGTEAFLNKLCQKGINVNSELIFGTHQTTRGNSEKDLKLSKATSGRYIKPAGIGALYTTSNTQAISCNSSVYDTTVNQNNLQCLNSVRLHNQENNVHRANAIREKPYSKLVTNIYSRETPQEINKKDSGKTPKLFFQNEQKKGQQSQNSSLTRRLSSNIDIGTTYGGNNFSVTLEAGGLSRTQKNNRIKSVKPSKNLMKLALRSSSVLMLGGESESIHKQSMIAMKAIGCVNESMGQSSYLNKQGLEIQTSRVNCTNSGVAINFGPKNTNGGTTKAKGVYNGIKKKKTVR